MDALRTARADLDAVIEEIRAVPGFETFLAAPAFADVAAAATERPIVYLTSALAGGLALIVRRDGVEHVALDGVDDQALRERVMRYLEAYSRFRADTAEAEGWGLALDEITRWLWDAAVGPVVERLEGEFVLVAGGLLGLLPLHAAWSEDASAPTGRSYALDRLDFSYAPNARAVSAAAEVAKRSRSGRVLALSDPQPVSATPLRWAAVECAAAVAGAAEATVLGAGEATARAFRREVGGVDVLHLACHGIADLNAPLESGVVLAGDEWIRLRELLQMRLQVRLAVLSACETSLPGTALPDEVIALPTGLLQAGVAGVVASQWAVPDFETTVLMTEFYRRWDDGSPGAALGAAQRWVRDTTNGEKVTEWERALNDRERWLPPAVGEALIGRLAFADPDGRGQSDPRRWAAFSHIGV